MIDITAKLIRTILTKDNIGNQIESNIEIEVPIIKNEDIYSKEFYEPMNGRHLRWIWQMIGLKPTLRLRISSLNYNNEKKLKYMNEIYEVIRVDRVTLDEIALICERKVGNGS